MAVVEWQVGVPETDELTQARRELVRLGSGLAYERRRVAAWKQAAQVLGNEAARLYRAADYAARLDDTPDEAAATLRHALMLARNVAEIVKGANDG